MALQGVLGSISEKRRAGAGEGHRRLLKGPPHGALAPSSWRYLCRHQQPPGGKCQPRLARALPAQPPRPPGCPGQLGAGQRRPQPPASLLPARRKSVPESPTSLKGGPGATAPPLHPGKGRTSWGVRLCLAKRRGAAPSAPERPLLVLLLPSARIGLRWKWLMEQVLSAGGGRGGGNRPDPQTFSGDTGPGGRAGDGATYLEAGSDAKVAVLCHLMQMQS